MVPSTSSDGWSSNEGYPFNQSNYNSSKKDQHFGEYSFNSCLPRPTAIAPSLPLALPVDTMSTSSNRFVILICQLINH